LFHALCALCTRFARSLALTLSDINYLERNAGGPELPVALIPKANKIAMMQMSSKLDLLVFDVVLNAACTAARMVHTLMEQHIKEHTGAALRNTVSAQ
jgi:exosome complex component RRP41